MENALQTITEALENAEVQGWRGKIFDYTLPIPEPEPIVSICGGYLVGKADLAILTGAPKCCKSTLLATIAASCLCGEEVLTLKASKPLKCLYLDTEQNESNLMYQVNRIFRLSKIEKRLTDALTVLKLRESSIVERCEFLREAIEELKPDIVFLDGAADLLPDTNELEASTVIIDELKRLSSEYKCGIITVIHTVPSQTKMRGHLGSEAARKAETVVMLKRDGMSREIEVTPMACRNKPFDKFVCFISDNGDLEYRSKEVCPRTCQDWLLYLMEPHIEYQNCTLVKMLKKQGFAKSTTIEALQEAVKNGSVIKNGAKYTVALWENDDEDDNEDDEEN